MDVNVSQLGLFTAPVAGDLLWWNLRRQDGGTDSRMHHLGCPVLHGDKWILNKWVRWAEQWKTHPCSDPRQQNFPSNLELARLAAASGR